MKISIVTLSFNQCSYLEECILSVLSQDYCDWELIIVDPGSTDLSRNIALSYARRDPRITVIFEQDSGPAEGLNKGFARATGEIVACLNSDDYYLKSTFKEVQSSFDRYPEADCIYSHGLILKNQKFKFQSSDKFNIKRYFSNRGLVLQQATFFRKSSLDMMNLKFNIQNKTSWDGELLIDLASYGGKFVKVLGNWGVFRIHSDSITGSERLSTQTKFDHLRILNNQLSLGMKFSLIDKLFMVIPLYSGYRRIRNQLLTLLWKLSRIFKNDM